MGYKASCDKFSGLSLHSYRIGSHASFGSAEPGNDLEKLSLLEN